VPNATFRVWELRVADGWLYGVEGAAKDRRSFAGMLWFAEQLSAFDLPRTSSGRLREVADYLRNLRLPALTSLIETALFKLVVEPAPPVRRAHLYISWLGRGTVPLFHPGVIIKKSRLSFNAGEETSRPLAYDAQNAMADWTDVLKFAERHSRLVWLEDPMPLKAWPADARCPVPIACGEHFDSVEQAIALCDRPRGTPIVLHLELSRLGPVGLADAVDVAARTRIPVAFHGHLPLDAALIAGYVGTESIVEVNVPHLADRVPWADLRQRLMDSIMSSSTTFTDDMLSEIRSVRPPAGASPWTG
jgi:hypothetical protein